MCPFSQHGSVKWIIYAQIFSRKPVASTLPWPATRRAGAHGQAGAPCRVEVSDGFLCPNSDVAAVQTQHQISVHEDMYQDANQTRDSQAQFSRGEYRVSTLGLPSPAQAVAARQARRTSLDATRADGADPALAKAAASRAAGEVGRRRSSARSASVASEPACVTTLEPEDMAMNDLKRSLSLASSESYFDVRASKACVYINLVGPMGILCHFGVGYRGFLLVWCRSPLVPGEMVL